jgi:hypothetical protein
VATCCRSSWSIGMPGTDSFPELQVGRVLKLQGGFDVLRVYSNFPAIFLLPLVFVHETIVLLCCCCMPSFQRRDLPACVIGTVPAADTPSPERAACRGFLNGNGAPRQESTRRVALPAALPVRHSQREGLNPFIGRKGFVASICLLGRIQFGFSFLP